MPYVIYLDESGDLGWTLDKPYQKGGSSKFLTLSFLITPIGEKDKPRRIVRKVYEHFKFDPKKEVKATDLTPPQLDHVAYQVANYVKAHGTFKLGSITVKKANVQQHIRLDSNKLYNYMIKLGVIDKVDKFDEVYLIRDNRSVKVKSGNSLRDYLQLVLYFERNSPTKLHDCPEESHQNQNLIFIDWMAHMIWSNYEFGQSKHFAILAKHMTIDRLFF